MTTTNMTSSAPARGIGFAGVLCLALITALLLALTPATQAHAVPPSGDRDTEIIITKLERPEAIGMPANGQQLGADVIGDMTPIGGVAFTAKQVPGIELTTNEGQVAAANLTVNEALALAADQPVADSGVTGTDGVLRLGGSNGKLGVGLYVIEETSAPAGVVPSAPFIVALPLTDPAGTGWMYTVYVYPKNDKVEVGINVVDEDAVVCTDFVTWITQNVIPQQPTITKYVTRNLIAPGAKLQSLDTTQVSISGAGSPTLVAGVDYVITAVADGEREGFDVEFTESGRTKLVEAKTKNPAAKVVVTYPTRISGTGEHVNEVQLTVDDSAPVTDTTLTKWGPLKIYVHERDDPRSAIPGAKFKLYTSAEDAEADRNAIEIGGETVFTTGDDGFITFHCLRFSSFVNGLDREPNDPLHRPYYAKPVSYPPGWEVNWDILVGEVNVANEEEAEVLIWPVWRDQPAVPTPATPSPAPGLSVTGGQIAGIGILAALLAGSGIVLFATRRRAKRDSSSGEISTQ